jgi:hypothetical protein
LRGGAKPERIQGWPIAVIAVRVKVAVPGVVIEDIVVRASLGVTPVVAVVMTVGVMP